LVRLRRGKEQKHDESSHSNRAAFDSLSLTAAFLVRKENQGTTDGNPQKRPLGGKEPNTVPIPLSSS